MCWLARNTKLEISTKARYRSMQSHIHLSHPLNFLWSKHIRVTMKQPMSKRLNKWKRIYGEKQGTDQIQDNPGATMKKHTLGVFLWVPFHHRWSSVREECLTIWGFESSRNPDTPVKGLWHISCFSSHFHVTHFQCNDAYLCQVSKPFMLKCDKWQMCDMDNHSSLSHVRVTHCAWAGHSTW